MSRGSASTWKAILALGGAEEPMSSIVPPLPLRPVLVGELDEEMVDEGVDGEGAAFGWDSEVAVLCIVPASNDVPVSVPIPADAVLILEVIEMAKVVGAVAEAASWIEVPSLSDLDVDEHGASRYADVASAGPEVSSLVSTEDITFGHILDNLEKDIIERRTYLARLSRTDVNQPQVVKSQPDCTKHRTSSHFPFQGFPSKNVNKGSV
ncbi:MAG: hypothetical protein Q9163_000251 [Psora crenata]